MPTPDEIQQSILDALERLAEGVGGLASGISRQVELVESATDSAKKANRRRETTLDDEKEISTRLAKNYKFRLGLEEETNPKLKKVVDNRFNIEQRIIDEAKRNHGEEVFVSAQRNKLFREQLQLYSAGNLEHGGVITRFKDLDKQQQAQLVSAATTQRKLKDEQEKFTKTVQTLANPGAAIGDMKGKFSSLGGALETGKESMIKLFGGGMAANVTMELLAASGRVAGAALEGAAKAALGMGKSLLNGERGMAVGAKATQTFTNSITSAVSAFGGLLMGIGGVMIVLAPFTLGVSALAGAGLVAAGGALKLGAAAAGVAADLNLMAAELNDKLYAGFRELGKASMTGADGMTGVINNLHKMGLTVAEFDKFSKVIAENSKEMKMFGATAEKGVNRFAEVAGDLYKSEMGRTLELMGTGAEEQYEHTAKYMALQARLGLQQDKNAGSLAKSTMSYIEELDKIAAITGATRKGQEDARNAVMAVEELRAGIMDERRKADAGDPQAMKRLAELEKALLVAAVLQEKGLHRQATGAAQYYGSGGAVMSTESAEFFSGQQKLIKDVAAGTKGVAQLSVEALQSTVDNARKFAAVRRVGGSTEGTSFGDKYAAVSDVADFIKGFDKAKLTEKAKVEKAGGTFNETTFFEEYSKRIQAEKKATDPSTKQNMENARTQMETALKLDTAVFKYNESVGINKMATDMFKKAVDLFAAVTGYKEKPRGTKPAAEVNAVKESADRRDVVTSIKARQNLLTDTIKKDELALKQATRNAASDEEIAKINERIANNTAEKEKLGKEFIIQHRKLSESLLKENEIKSKQKIDRAELARLEVQSTRGNSRSAPATKDKQEFYDKMYKVLLAEAKNAKIANPEAIAKLGATQSSLETGYGKHLVGGNNFFGIKAAAGKNSVDAMTTEHENGVDVKKLQKFRKYEDTTGGESAADYIKFLQENKRYTDVLAAKTADEAIAAQAKTGYATDPKYKEKLQSIANSMKMPATESAASGGLFSGPSGGYQVELHGREAVVPMPNPGTMLASNETANVQKDSLSSVMPPSAPVASNDNGMLFEMLQLLAEKMDKVGDYINHGNDTREEILKYSRA